jgi:probable rRNA maturation factor
LGKSKSELSILVVGDDKMQKLNLDWRGKDRPTDVLSFPMEEGEDASSELAAQSGEEKAAECLGDIVRNMDAAKRQADELGFSLEEEAVRLLVHGLAHLLGYDHEKSEEEAIKMRAIESNVLKELGVNIEL